MLHLNRLLRIEFKALYKSCDSAFAALDKLGIGGITEASFIDSLACQRAVQRHNRILSKSIGAITKEDIRYFLQLSNVFTKELILFQTFKQVFFPHLCHATEVATLS